MKGRNNALIELKKKDKTNFHQEFGNGFRVMGDILKMSDSSILLEG